MVASLHGSSHNTASFTKRSRFSDISFSTTLLTLAVFTMVVMPTAPAMPLTLLITSNIEPGIAYDGGMGPFIIGKNLTIICSAEKAKALSWWEGDKQLPAFVSVEKGIVSCSLIVGPLKAEYSRRHFTCRELVSGTEKSVDLHLINEDMDIHKDGIPLGNGQTVEVFARTNFSMDCIVNGSNPSSGSWWEGETKLPSIRTRLPNAINSHLTLRPARYEDNGRELKCRARNGQLTKSVVLKVVKERKNETPPGSTGTSKATTTTISLTSSTTTSIRNISSIRGKVPDEDVASSNVSLEKRTVTTGETKSVATSTPDGQDIPVSETASNANSVATKTTEKQKEKNEIMKYFIVGGAVIISIGLLVGILIFLMQKLCRKINQLNTSTSQQHGNSCEQRALAGSSVQSTLESLDPLDQNTVEPLLHNIPPV